VAGQTNGDKARLPCKRPIRLLRSDRDDVSLVGLLHGITHLVQELGFVR
ncbi:hypothetical protein ADUPG1_003914, partial [Aduncisulcus paluster]